MSYSKPLSSSSNCSWKIPPANDFLKIAGFTMIPTGVMFLNWCWYEANGKQSKVLFDKLEKPSWAVTNVNQMATMDYATMLPLGYALYLVAEHSTSRDDVKKALALFGGTMGTITLATIAFSGSHDLKCWTGASTAVAAVAGATAVAFGKVDKAAGWLMVPFVAWSTFQTLAMIATYFKNKDKTFTFVKKENL